MQTNIIYNENCLDLLKRLPDNSVDFTAIDPPYTDGTKDVLAGHKIQTKLDIKAITKEIYRVQKPNTFYAFFGQMPTILAWYNAAVEAGFEFREEIIWCKMNISPLGGKVKRMHEKFFILSKGAVNFYKVDGDYEDVSQALTMNGLMNIESTFRNLSYLKSKLSGKEPKQCIDKSNGKSYDELMSSKFNDWNKFENSKGFNKDFKNFSTIWAFLPHNKKNRNPENGQVSHPSVKPIPLLERLIELCTPEQENITVLDCFLGSGTTILACINTNRQYIGCELHTEYYEIAKARIAKVEAEKTQQLFTA